MSSFLLMLLLNTLHLVFDSLVMETKLEIMMIATIPIIEMVCMMECRDEKRKKRPRHS